MMTCKRRSAVYKYMLCLTGVLVCLTSLPGLSFAWRDFTQSCTNSFRGRVQRASVVLRKHEKTTAGTLTSGSVPDAEFKLYRMYGEEGYAVQIGDTYFTDQTGSIAVDGLTPGEYYFEEINPGYGYKYDKDNNGEDITRYDFTVENENTDIPVSVTAYNRRIQGSLIVGKLIYAVSSESHENTELPDINENNDMEFEFAVHFSDNRVYSYILNGGDTMNPVEGRFCLRDGDVAEFSGIPEGVTYALTEISANENGFTAAVETITGVMGSGEAKAYFGNYLNPEIPEEGSVEITKEVLGNNADKTKKFSFVFELSDDNAYPCSINGDLYGGIKNGDIIELSHGQKAVISGIPAGTVYSLTEQNYIKEGYIPILQKQSGTVPSGTSVTAEFVNQYSPPTLHPGKVVVQKKIRGKIPTEDRYKSFVFIFREEGKTPVRFSLKAGESKTFILPVGAGYKVTEKDYKDEGYRIASKINTSGTVREKTVKAVIINEYTGKDKPDKPGKPHKPGKDKPGKSDLNKTTPDSEGGIYVNPGKDRPDRGDDPVTNDNNEMMIWLAIMILAAASFAGVIIDGRRFNG